MNEKRNPSKPKKTKRMQVDEEYRKDLHRVAKDCIVIYDDKGKPDMLVHTKNKTANKITKTAAGKAFRLHEKNGKPAHLLPLKHDKHLELDSRLLHGRAFGDIEDLVKFAKAIKGAGPKFRSFGQWSKWLA